MYFVVFIEVGIGECEFLVFWDNNVFGLFSVFVVM